MIYNSCIEAILYLAGVAVSLRVLLQGDWKTSLAIIACLFVIAYLKRRATTFVIPKGVLDDPSDDQEPNTDDND